MLWWLIGGGWLLLAIVAALWIAAAMRWADTGGKQETVEAEHRRLHLVRS